VETSLWKGFGKQCRIRNLLLLYFIAILGQGTGLIRARALRGAPGCELKGILRIKR